MLIKRTLSKPRTLKALIKQKVYKTTQTLSFNLGISPKLAKLSSVARILMFHGIDEVGHPSALLEQKIVFLKKHFNVVTLDHILAMNSAGDKFTNELVITFDDGLKNNASNAYPILQKHNVPATFYVCPGLIESGSWLWNHEARERLRSLPAAQLTELASEWNCPNELEDMVEWLKGLEFNVRTNAEKRIREASVTFSPSAEQRIAYDMISWNELSELDPKLITVGSHTTNHVISKNLSEAKLDLEIIKSKHTLETKLDRDIDHFCYPNGVYDSATVNVVKNTYRSGVTATDGVVYDGDDPYLLNRVPSEKSLEYFAWRLIRTDTGS